MKVLVAEDDPVAIVALEAVLKQAGHTVTVASSGSEAWPILQRERYEIAILDWMMPEMDGIELTEKIRNELPGPYICIIMVTAKQEREDRLKALSAGVDVFLTKPINMADLLARVQVAVRILALETQAA